LKGDWWDYSKINKNDNDSNKITILNAK
jgi:hypothetical protein